MSRREIMKWPALRWIRKRCSTILLAPVSSVLRAVFLFTAEDEKLDRIDNNQRIIILMQLLLHNINQDINTIIVHRVFVCI